MDIPRLFKCATPDLVKRKGFRIAKTGRKIEQEIEEAKESIELTINEPMEQTSETSSDTTATSRAENSKVPVLAIGTYHRKEAAPILATAATRFDTVPKKESTTNPLPHPADCVAPSSSSLINNGEEEMFPHHHRSTQGPPPAWQPPRPPGFGGVGDHDYTNDYEDPEELARQRDGSSNLLIKTTTPPPANNSSYEMSLSQQRRSQQQQMRSAEMSTAPPFGEWPPSDGSILHKNAEGAYYIPSGSLRTTSSTLSPASGAGGQRYHEQPAHHGVLPANACYSDATSTLLKYPLTGTQQNRRRQVSTMNNNNHHNLLDPNASIKKKKKLEDDESANCWRRAPSKCTLLLASALILAIFIILFMLFKSPSYVYTEPSPSGELSSRYTELGIRALPPAISLGERIDVEFFPRHMATTELILSRSARIVFNATVGSGAQLVMLIRAGVPPSMSLHDALFPIRADRMREVSHIVEELPPGPVRSRRNIIGGGSQQQRESMEIMSPRSTTFEQFLLEGRHFLTFINERNRIEPISFIAQQVARKPDVVEDKTARKHPLAPVCEANCNQRGECVMGKCQCAAGYTGKLCEEAICPVVCSGNGIFSGGSCICKSGFKGRECEMRSTWCEVADCNGRGKCDSNVGRCRCDARWTGDACELRACPHPTCSDRGLCSNGTCYCQEGWRGDDCSMFADAIVPIRRPVANREVVPTTTTTTTPTPTTQMTPRNEEDVKSCLNNGRLVDDECVCSQGFGGINCETKTCSSCFNGDCHDGKCHCWKGFGGKSCDTQECAIGCEDHGKCLKNGTCKCQPGWNGDNCYMNGCPNQCSAKGECHQNKRNGEWWCECQAGQTGPDCSLSIELHCDDGLDNDNDGLVDCDDPECCDNPSCADESVCSTATSPTDVLLRMPPIFNANFAQRVGFLIKEKSVQSYTDAAQFNDTTIAVIRGRVAWRTIREDVAQQSPPSVPLPGVRVSDAAHPLYGFTLSRSDGYFDLVVNGARSVNLQFLRNQFKSVKIGVFVPPGQITTIDDVVLYRSGSAAPPLSQAARPKCSPTSRKIPEITIVSNWQYAKDGVEGTETKLLMDSRSIFEALPIQGTDLRLVYDSARCAASPATMLIGLLGEQVDKEIRRVHLNVRVAGREFDYTLAPRVNLTHVFTWDKMNAYRQSETGLVATMIRIGYEYLECERAAEIVWISRRAQMLGAVARKMIGNMWTLDVHHHLDIVNNIVEKGDGGYRLISELEPMVTTIAGVDGVKRDIDCTNMSPPDNSCEGAKMARVALFRPTCLVYANDGSLIIGDHNLIRRITPDGAVNTILTLSLADTSHSYYLAVSPLDGTLAISLPLHKQIWKISTFEPQEDSKSNYEILAGDGSVCGSAVDGCGDGGLAQNAQLIFPKGLAYDRNGNLYFADSRRIRVIDTAGHIRSIGEPTPDSHPIRNCANAQMSKLVDLQMEWPTSITIDAVTNSIFILDTNVVYEIDGGDVVRIVLGQPATCSTPTAAANHTALQNPKDISVANDGSLYVVESDGKRVNQIRKLSPDRATFATVAGGKSPCSCDIAACGCDDSDATVVASLARFNSPQGIAVAPNGELVIADTVNAKIRRITRRGAKWSEKRRQYEVTDGERMEKLVFNRHGLHTATISMISGRALLNFTYTVDSPVAQLASINGANGMQLRLNRPNQTQIELETSRGVQTLLTMSAYDATLEQVLSRPASLSRDTTKLAYTPKGLLASRVDVASAVAFEYDAMGRAEAIRRDRELWRLGRETIQIGGGVTADVWLNDRKWSQVRMSDGDLAMAMSRTATTRLITLRREGYSIQSPFGTASLFDTSIPRGFDEPVVSRRRTTVPAIQDPQRRALTTRWDWRYTFKKSDEDDGEEVPKRVAEVGFRTRINGVNIFSMEYNIANNRDTLRLGSTSDDSSILLNIDYSDSGEIRKIWTPSESQLDELFIDTATAKKREIKWGKWKIEKSYDSLNRLVEIVEDGGRVPLKMAYSNEKRRHPTTIQRDSSKWNIQYDNYDRIKEVVNEASGESTTFSAISLGAREWVLKRRSALNTRPAMIRISGDEEIEEYATPDGLHHFMRERNEEGNIERILNDGSVTRVECWAPDGTIACLRHGKEWKMNLTWQGHLIARKSITIFGKSSSFSYEYDDLLRPISIQPVIEQSVVEPIQMSYDERTGRIASLNGFSVISDATTSRSQGHGLMYETSKIDSHRQIVEIKMIYGDARAKLSIKRDRVGRAQETSIEVEASGFSKNLKTSRSFDGSGRLAGIEQGDSLKMNLKYNTDGRVEKLNDQIVEYHRGGALKSFQDTQYTVDSIGWVVKRANVSFAYDGKGRLVRAGDFELLYDHEDRLISLRRGEDVTILYYSDVQKSHTTRISHFSRNGVIFTMFYDDNSLLFAMSSSDGRRFGVVCDETRTPRVVATDSKIVKYIERSVFGKIIESLDDQENLWMPVGYLGGVELDGLDVVVLEHGRPFDLISGRYLSVSPEAVKRVEIVDLATSIDLMALETERQPFALPRIPTDFESWFKLVGLSPDLLPNIHLGLPPSHPITHRLLDSFPSKLDSLSHVNTIRPSRLVDSESRDSQQLASEWSIEDVGFSNLLLINKADDSKQHLVVDTQTLPILDVQESEIVHKLLDAAHHVDFLTWSPVPVRHFWKSPTAMPHTLTSASLPHFTLVVNKESAELRNGKSKIIVHFANDEKEVIKKLTDDLRSREMISVWKAERKRLDDSTADGTWHQWTDRERRELKSKGTVSGYTIDTRPTHHCALFATIHSWKFVAKN